MVSIQRRFLSLFFILVAALSFTHLDAYWALVSVPVANCTHQPLSELYNSTAHLASAYTHIPISWAGDKNRSCPRVTQLLFNESVYVIEHKGDEVCVEIPHLFLARPEKSHIQNPTFWTHSSFIIPHRDIMAAQTIPPIIYASENNTVHAHVITLKEPFYDSESGISFSAGTRFVCNDTRSNSYRAHFFNPNTFKVHTVLIPQQYATYPYSMNMESRLSLFIALLQYWANTAAHGYVPFVWGGSSLVSYEQTNTFYAQHAYTTKHEDASYWHRPFAHAPYTGFDASGLIWRAAQIAGLPYFCMNSTTANALLRPVGAHEVVRNGDLLYTSNGIAVISDVHSGIIISARGYQSGYGVVTEIHCSELFSSIYSIEQLHEQCTLNTPLILKDSTRGQTSSITGRILSLRSSW